MEITTKELPEIKVEDVICVYVGKPNNCMCGCSGKYTYTKINQERGTSRRGYKVTDDEVNDKEVMRVVSHIQKHVENGVSIIPVDEGFCLTVEIGKTQYSIYTT